jgi:hypothetical protein
VHFSNNQLYERVINITHEYLGSMSKRCIDGQITHHLHKPPEEIDENDLKLLISWIEALTALLTGDRRMGGEIRRRLESLTQTQRIA